MRLRVIYARESSYRILDRRSALVRMTFRSVDTKGSE